MPVQIVGQILAVEAGGKQWLDQGQSLHKEGELHKMSWESWQELDKTD